MQAAAAAAAVPPPIPLIQKPQLQSRILFLILQIQNAIYDRMFYELVMRATGDTLRDKDARSLYRFFMRGSSAAAFYTKNMQVFPFPFTSDIDMMVLIDPRLSAIQFNTIHALLYKRVLDTILEFTKIDAVKYLDNFFISDSYFDKNEINPAVPEPEHSKRAISISNPFLDDTPFGKIFQPSDELKVGYRSMFQVSITSDVVYQDSSGHPKQMGNSLITVIPRDLDATPVLDISFPKLNFLDSPDKSQLFYELIETGYHQYPTLNVPKTSVYSFSFETGKFKTSRVGEFPAFQLTIPIVSINYAEIDAYTAVETTYNNTKKGKRIALASALRNVITGYK